MSLVIVEWVTLDCGHEVDLTASEREALVFDVDGERKMFCPKCGHRAGAPLRRVVSSRVPPTTG